MNDQAAWDQAVATAHKMYTGLPSASAAELNGLIEQIIRFKQNLVELVTAAGSSNICRTCGGECCLHGKYHVSVLDVLAYLKNGRELIVPDFSSSPDCPYSGASGCTMAPGYRPMTCVVFNCQQVEDQLTPAQRSIFQTIEQDLRAAVIKAGHIAVPRLDRALLLSCG